jgi:hypothetical protein
MQRSARLILYRTTGGAIRPETTKKVTIMNYKLLGRTFIVALAMTVGATLLFWGSSFATNMVHDQLSDQKIFFPAKGNIGFNKGGWGGAVSVWCKTDPNKLLKTKFCDPIQIAQKGANDGARKGRMEAPLQVVQGHRGPHRNWRQRQVVTEDQDVEKQQPEPGDHASPKPRRDARRRRSCWRPT